MTASFYYQNVFLELESRMKQHFFIINNIHPVYNKIKKKNNHVYCIESYYQNCIAVIRNSINCEKKYIGHICLKKTMSGQASATNNPQSEDEVSFSFYYLI